MTSATGATVAEELEAMRAELDRIDERLLDTLRARFACCERIARHKREHGISMMQPHRIGIVQERAARYAEAHAMSAPFLRRLYDLVIAEACRLEDLVIEGAGSRER